MPAWPEAYGAEGIGLTRTEHMFFDQERLPIVQKMITATIPADRNRRPRPAAAVPAGDFEGLFRAMDGLPVTIRLIDPRCTSFCPPSRS
jgi:pyruvate, orthophosphate dikinase